MNPKRFSKVHSKSLVGSALLAMIAATSFTSPGIAADGMVNVYSYRKEALIKPQLDAFTAASGIRVNLVTGKADALLERLKSEGRNSPADILLTTDIGRMMRARDAGVLKSVQSTALASSIPAKYRDPEGHWFGLSVRARIIFYAPDRVKASELSTYEDLTQPKWKNRVCIRSSSNVYNQSLLASMIKHNGAVKAEAWARGMVANFARKPQGGDRDQIRAVAAGECDVAVANTYYYAAMGNGKKKSDRAAASKVNPYWPNQAGRGAHVNISGGAVTASAKNTANAVKLLEFLASPDAQRLYADVVNEYPVRAGVPVSSAVKAMGDFKADGILLAEVAKHQADAIRMFDRVGWR